MTPGRILLATLNDAKRNYDIYDLELLAAQIPGELEGIPSWVPHKVIVFTDHMNLQ